VVGTIVVAAGALIIGLVAHSMAIVFDGLFSTIEVAMSLLALFAARVVAREANRRFQYGYWHIEPLVLAFNAGALSLLCLWGLIDAVVSLLSGGREADLGWAVAYSAAAAAIAVLMTVRLRGSNQGVASDLVALESDGWLLSAYASAALLVGFGLAWASQGTPFSYVAAYADPLILGVLSIAFLPVPARTLRRSVSEILLITPQDLDQRVRATMDEIAERRGYLGYTSYSAKVGRGRFVEIHVRVDGGSSLGTVDEVDAARNEIAEALEMRPDEDWLTVDFTADKRWM
jgi:cation diffusion facilitator family transporter